MKNADAELMQVAELLMRKHCFTEVRLNVYSVSAVHAAICPCINVQETGTNEFDLLTMLTAAKSSCSIHHTHQ
jgi:hypothetical protein